MLGHLTADQGAAGLLATGGDALDDLGDVLGTQLADGDVIREEQRLGTDGHDVVDAHGNQVLAHGVVTAQQLGDRELGAHAVGATHQDGVVHVLEGLHREARAKATQPADDLGSVGLANAGLDRVNRACALVHVHAGVGVGHVPVLLAHA